MLKAKDFRKARREAIRKWKNTVLGKIHHLSSLDELDVLFIVNIGQHCTVYKSADRVDRLLANLGPTGMSSEYYVNQSLSPSLSTVAVRGICFCVGDVAL